MNILSTSGRFAVSAKDPTQGIQLPQKVQPALAGQFAQGLQSLGVRLNGVDFSRVFGRFGSAAKRALPLITVLPSLAMSGNEQLALVTGAACLAGSLFIIGFAGIAYFSPRAKTQSLPKPPEPAPSSVAAQTNSAPRLETVQTIQRELVRDPGFVPERLERLVDALGNELAEITDTHQKASVAKPTLPLFDALTIDAALAIDQAQSGGDTAAEERNLRNTVTVLNRKLSHYNLILNELTRLSGICEDKNREQPLIFTKFKAGILVKIDSCRLRLGSQIENFKFYATSHGLKALRLHLDSENEQDKLAAFNEDLRTIIGDIRNARNLQISINALETTFSACAFAANQLKNDEQHAELKLQFDVLEDEINRHMAGINTSDEYSRTLSQLKNRADALRNILEEALLNESGNVAVRVP